MQQTEHYQLSQWEFEDQILMADFNNDNQKIDAALHELAGQVAGKANTSTVSSLTTKVNKKAEQSALIEAENRITVLENGTASQTNLTALTNRVTALENGKVEKADHTADVAALRSENCWVKLGTTRVTSAKAAVDLSLSGINAADYMEFRVYCRGTASDLYLRLNGSASSQYFYSYENGTNGGTNEAYIQLTVRASVGFGGVLHLYPHAAGGTGTWYQGASGGTSKGGYIDISVGAAKSTAFSSLKTINLFSNSGTISSGSEFTLYGLKA